MMDWITVARLTLLAVMSVWFLLLAILTIVRIVDEFGEWRSNRRFREKLRESIDGMEIDEFEVTFREIEE